MCIRLRVLHEFSFSGCMRATDCVFILGFNWGLVSDWTGFNYLNFVLSTAIKETIKTYISTVFFPADLPVVPYHLPHYSLVCHTW